MKCEECGRRLSERVSTDQIPYKYDLCGLDNVWLVGITVLRCTQCGDETPVIPRIGELHRVIAGTLQRKQGPLTGAEVVFLRKQIGMSAKELAEHLGINPSYLSRFENGKRKELDKSKDQLIRVIVAASHAAPSKRILEMITGAGETRKETGVFENNAKKWSVAA